MPPLLNNQLMVAEIGDQAKLAAESFHIGTDRGKRRGVEFALLQTGNVRLGHADDLGDVNLGERQFPADLRETVGTDFGVELGAVRGDPGFIGDSLGPDLFPGPGHLFLAFRECFEVLVEPGVRDRDVLVVPLVPGAGLVAGHQQDRFSLGVEGEDL